MIKKRIYSTVAVAIAIGGVVAGFVGSASSSPNQHLIPASARYLAPTGSKSLVAPSVTAQQQVQADINCIQTGRVSNNAASLGSHKSLAKTDGLLKGCQSSDQAWLNANPVVVTPPTTIPPPPTTVPPTPTTVPPTPTTIPPPPSSTGFASRVGIYSGYQADNSGPAKAIGITKFPYVMSFVTGSNTGTISGGAASLAQWATAQGSTLIAPFNMLPDSGVTAAQAATGAMNATASTFGKDLVANGQANAIIRIGWEFNGDWFPWGTSNINGAAQFLQIWHQEVTSFQAVAGNHFTYYWNPTLDTSHDLTAYLPPKSEVNYLGLDLYDQTNGAYPGPQSAWQGYLTAQTGLNWISTEASSRGEGIILGEVGNGYNVINGQVANGGDNPYFWQQTVSWSASHNVTVVTLWDDGGDLLNGNSPKSQAELKSLVAA